MSVAEFALRSCFSGTELAGLESYLSGQPGVHEVSIDRTRSVAHVSYDAAATSIDHLRSFLDGHGYGCDGTDCVESRSQPGHPAVGRGDALV